MFPAVEKAAGDFLLSFLNYFSLQNKGIAETELTRSILEDNVHCGLWSAEA